MIPPLKTRPLSLQPPILNREQIRKNPLLLHRNPKHLAPVPGARSQLFTRRPHRLPLSLQLDILRLSSLRLVPVPGAVDRPVAEVACARETERTRRFGVVEEVAD